MEFITGNEALIRLSVFLGIFALMAAYEMMAPKRILTASKPRRWGINLSITALNTLAVRFIFPSGAVGVAIFAQERSLGLLNASTISPETAGLISIVLLDLVIYTQHVVFHHFGPLWRLHMMHHTDLDLDVTSGARFHPVEIILSMIVKICFILALGAPPWAVVTFEVILNGMAMFNHSNVRMPAWVDEALRMIVVTPDMHRVHHSVIIRETNSNFGFNLSVWDRIFGTYRPQPRDGHDGMKIGLANHRDINGLSTGKLLALPFKARY